MLTRDLVESKSSTGPKTSKSVFATARKSLGAANVLPESAALADAHANVTREAAKAMYARAVTDFLFFILDPFNPQRLPKISFVFFVHYVVIEPDTGLDCSRLPFVRPS